MSGAALLKFPVQSVIRHVEAPEAPPLDVIDRGNSKLLLETARYVLGSAKTLVEFVTDNRLMARQLGIDTIVVELSGLEVSGKLQQVKDALEESVSLGAETKLTLEGLQYLKRAEKLVSDASLAIARATGDAPAARLGGSELSLGEDTFTKGLILLGLVSVIALTVIVVVYAPRKR